MTSGRIVREPPPPGDHYLADEGQKVEFIMMLTLSGRRIFGEKKWDGLDLTIKKKETSNPKKNPVISFHFVHVTMSDVPDGVIILINRD